nr:hypothetical protein [Janthinobacterium sp. Marseille]
MPDRHHKEKYKGWSVFVWITSVKSGPSSASPIDYYTPGIVVKQIKDEASHDHPLVLTNRFQKPDECLTFGIEKAREYIDQSLS